ncbi:methyl-accepting chemotaxis protein [Pseudaeromonas sp. ZJS20]|uniref:methyl-accepting chemotaxis protein n=1 Tax=Pseudaeromonas aegiceratis TaxID=3153928 RepID=UPI00390C5DCC
MTRLPGRAVQCGTLHRWISHFSFNGKMRILLVFVMLLTMIGNLISANITREEIRQVIEAGLMHQVQSYGQLLAPLLAQDPDNFIKQATPLLESARWGEGKSGYLFITNRQGQLLVYPPDHARLGNYLDPVPLQDSDENVNQAFVRIAKSGQAELIRYPYMKPGSDHKTLKAAYVYPMGDYMLVSGVYLDAADDAFYSYLKHSVGILLVILLALALLVGLFARTLSAQVKQALAGLQAIANKNLTQPIHAIGRDEFATINQALESTRLQLAGLLHQQQGNALSLSAASSQLNDGMQEVGHAIIEQRQRLDNLAAAMEQMVTTIREVAQNAQHSAVNAQETDQLAGGGVGKIGSTIQAIERLSSDLDSSAQSVNEVEDKVSVISSVVDTINGISEQTNLLALNAAIEAARAGEQGRGFAVVADEVRQLAKRTQQATREIADMITALQQQTREAVDLMQTSVKTAHQAKGEAGDASERFMAIAQQTGELSEHSEMIASAAEEQTLVANQVTDALVVIRDAVEETEHVAKELGQTSLGLRHAAEGMEQMVMSYQLPR